MAQQMLRAGRREDVERDRTFGHEHASARAMPHPSADQSQPRIVSNRSVTIRRRVARRLSAVGTSDTLASLFVRAPRLLSGESRLASTLIAVENGLKTLPAMLPAPVRRPVRVLYDAVGAYWRLRQLGRHVTALRTASHRTFDDATRLAALSHAWGNENWSADVGYLRALTRRMTGAKGPILECGTGLSTIVAGVLADRQGIEVLSLEQDAMWAEFVQSRLSRLGISSVTLVHAPLRAYEGFLWYDVDAVKLPECFELAVCDGPAIYGQPEPYQAAWRVGLLPVLRDRGVRVSEILMDDAEDDRTPALRALWERDYRLRMTVEHTPTGDYLIALP